MADTLVALPLPTHRDLTAAPVVFAVMRRLGPQLIEATLVPTLLCYAGVLTVGLTWGVVAAALWTALAIGLRVANGRRVTGLLVVASAGLLVRIGIYLLSGSAFVYFLQPIARTVVMAALFAASALIGRPLVARFAGDFCSFDDEVGRRPAIHALFRRLTYLWAGGQVAIASVNLTLLLTVPVTVFIGTAAGAAWVIIGICLVATVTDAVRTTKRDGLHTTLSRGGRLHTLIPASPTGTPVTHHQHPESPR
jgi:hypothetical protein